MTMLRGIQLAATDPDRSVAFYQALGYTLVGRAGETRQLAIVGRPEFTLSIRPGAGAPPPDDFAGPGVVVVDYYTADMTEALRVLQAAGGRVWSGPITYSFVLGELQHTMISGPDGERVGLIQVARKPGLVDWDPNSSLFSEPALAPIGVADLPAALAWYQQTFGWGVATDVELDDGPIRQVIRVPAPTPVHVNVLNTNGPSRPTPELLMVGAPRPTATVPTVGVVGLSEPGGDRAVADPFSGVTYTVR